MAFKPIKAHHVLKPSSKTRWNTHVNQALDAQNKSIQSLCRKAKYHRTLMAPATLFVELMEIWDNSNNALEHTKQLLEAGHDVGAAHAFFAEMGQMAKKDGWPAINSTLKCPATDAEVSLIHRYDGKDPAYNFLSYIRDKGKDCVITPVFISNLIEEIEITLMFQMPPDHFPAFHPRETFPEDYRQALIHWKGAFTKFLHNARSEQLQLL